jgi:endonuclease-8
VAEFHTAKSLARRYQLGPDVMSANFDQAAAVLNLESHPDLEVGVALLTQSIIAGIGNLYKSEICFQTAINPFERISALSRDQLQSLVSTAKKLMSAPRSHFVYRRTGDPCTKCGTPILSRKQGVDARTTFWCPICQQHYQLVP